MTEHPLETEGSVTPLDDARRPRAFATLGSTMTVAAQTAHEQRLARIALSKTAALAAFRQTATVADACAAAGVSRSAWYYWVAGDPEFARQAFDANESVA